MHMIKTKMSITTNVLKVQKYKILNLLEIIY